eukprot:1118919-Pleurochrysis_carterae.AAC.1
MFHRTFGNRSDYYVVCEENEGVEFVPRTSGNLRLGQLVVERRPVRPIHLRPGHPAAAVESTANPALLPLPTPTLTVSRL